MVALAHSVRKASAEKLAKKRVLLLKEPTRPPPVDDLWSRTWFVVFVSPKAERQVRRGLEAMGYLTFLPVRTYWNSSRFRVKRQLECPLLANYLFVGVLGRHRTLSDRDWNAFMQVEDILSVLGDKGGSPVPAPIENVVQIAGEVAAGVYDATGNTYDAGTTLLITKGVFASFPSTTEEAVPLDAAPDDLVSVAVRIFGRDTIMRIPLADLKPIR